MHWWWWWWRVSLGPLDPLTCPYFSFYLQVTVIVDLRIPLWYQKSNSSLNYPYTPGILRGWARTWCVAAMPPVK